MKKLIVLIITCIFTSGVFAQDYQNDKMQNQNQNTPAYCAMLKDGKMILMADGKQMNGDVKLNNGTKITPDAVVVKKDGTQTVLKNGECVDKDGNIVDKLIEKQKK